MLMAAIYLAEITPELSLDRLLVGTGGLGILFLLVKGFLAHLQKVEERHQGAAQQAQDNFRDDIKAMRSEHLAERKESQEDYRRSLRQVVSDLHPQIAQVAADVKEANKRLEDVGDHLAAMNRPKP